MSALGMLRAALMLTTIAGAAIAGTAPVEAGPAGPEQSAAEPPLGAEGFLSAGRQIEEGERWIGEGLVDVRFRGVVIQADRAELDRRTRNLVAEGNVVLQEGERRLAGERLEFNLDTKVGRLWQVWGYSDPDVYFTARELERKGEKRYALHGATVTSCNQANPIWQIKAASGEYQVDGWVRLVSARLEIMGVPVFWLPFFQYPAKRDRATGFLFPSVGKNSERGFYMANSFFWAISRSYDATLTHEWYADAASIVRSEWTWAPAEGARGRLQTENLFEQGGRNSGRYVLDHNQNFRGGWQVGADVVYATDEALDREYSNSINRISQRTRNSDALIARRWSRWNLAAAFHHQQLLGDFERKDFFLPSLEFSARDSKLLGPFYGRGGIRGSNFGTEFGDKKFRWQRADFDPTLSAPLVPFPWLKLKPEATYRLTWYSDSYVPDGTQSSFSGENFLRRYFHAGMSLIGPVFNRIWHTSGGFYSDKFKHVIEPAVVYDYTSDFDPDRLAPVIDSIDRLPRVNQVTFGLRNRFYAKRSLRPGMPGAPYEFLNLGVSLGYSLDPDLAARPDGQQFLGEQLPGAEVRRRGPLVADLRFAPTPKILTSYRLSYDTYDNFFSQQSLQSSWRADGWYLDLAWSRTRNDALVTGQTVRGRVSSRLFGGRIDLGGGASYDIERSQLLEASVLSVWHTQCCGIGFGYQRRKIGVLDDDEFRFSLSLKNVGTVFDYTLGDSQL